MKSWLGDSRHIQKADPSFDGERPADDCGISSVSGHPERVADHDRCSNLKFGISFSGESPEKWQGAEHSEKLR